MNHGPSLKELFNDALELPVSERADYLERACAGDAALRAKVERLLALHESAPSFLDAPTAAGTGTLSSAAPDAAATVHSQRESPGTRIGAYKLLQLIGEGGFGSVFMADQEAPVRRRVALKIIKLGMDTQQVIARFEAERQALAMMEHPNIARVFDAGATATGRPYFVMELVRGEPITDYCDRNQLGIRERLELLAQVCYAVQHAHQKGIIHRDIKPSNVLVTSTDGKAIPTVIDFGIAKATSVRLTERTLFTEHRQLIGTPEYMSPEQAEMTASDIDTRSDVYSLGVLLYELLTGALPFDPQRLRSAAFAEIQRIIREEDPPTPSARLSTLATLPSVAARRHIDPARLRRLVRGDLDWIVMKCLEKNRARRYETASAVAQDVQRHLAGEPILAAPPSPAYRVRKFVRRHRVGVLAGAAIIATLLFGIIGTSIGMISALREKARADVAAHAEAYARQQAQGSATVAAQAAEMATREAQRASEAEADAEQRAMELAQVVQFQASQLAEIDAALMGIRWRRALLDEVRKGLERQGKEADEINERVEVMERELAGANFTNLAMIMLEQNIFDRTLQAISKQFADQPLVRARLLQTVADTLRELGLWECALAPQNEALEIRRGLLGDKHPDTLTSINSMAGLLEARSDTHAAETLYREALAGRRQVLGEDHAHTLNSSNNLGILLQEQGRFSEAEPYLRETLEMRRRTLGDEHPDTLSSMNNLGLLRRAQGRLSEAEPFLRESLEKRRRVLGSEHTYTLNAMNNMASLLEAQARFAEAEPYRQELLVTARHVLGDEHPSTLRYINNLGALFYAQDRLSDAEPLMRETLEIRRHLLGDDHASTLNSTANLGALLLKLDRPTDAEPYLRAAMEGNRRVLGDEHPRTLSSLNNLAALFRLQGRIAEAEPLLREALAARRRLLGDDHPETLPAVTNLGRLLVECGELLEAEELLLPAVPIAEAHVPRAHPLRGKLLEVVSQLYEAWDLSEPNQGYDVLATEWRAKLDAWQSSQPSSPPGPPTP